MLRELEGTANKLGEDVVGIKKTFTKHLSLESAFALAQG